MLSCKIFCQCADCCGITGTRVVRQCAVIKQTIQVLNFRNLLAYYLIKQCFSLENTSRIRTFADISVKKIVEHCIVSAVLHLLYYGPKETVVLAHHISNFENSPPTFI